MHKSACAVQCSIVARFHLDSFDNVALSYSHSKSVVLNIHDHNEISHEHGRSRKNDVVTRDLNNYEYCGKNKLCVYI